MPEQKEKIFADGFRFERPKEGSPEWIKGKISVKVPEAIQFLTKHQSNAGWVNLDLKKSSKGTLYLELNTWQPPKAEKPTGQGRVYTEVDYPKEELGLPEF